MPRLVVIQGLEKGKNFELLNGNTFIGRSSRNDIILLDKSVSNRHLKVFQIGRKYFVEDLKSTNGTRINNLKVDSGEGFEVSEGDLIRLGRTLIRIKGLPTMNPIENTIAAHSKEAPKPQTQKPAETDRRLRSDNGMQLFKNVSRLLKQSFNLHIFCRKVLEYILESMPRVDTGALVYLDPFKQTRLKNKTLVIFSKPGTEYNPRNIVSETVIDRVLENRKVIRVLNAACEYSGDVDSANSELLIRSVLCIPLISNCVIRGALYLHSTSSPCGFRKEDLFTLNTLSASLAVAFENALLYGRPRGPLPAT